MSRPTMRRKKVFGEIVKRRDAVVHALILEVERLRGGSEEGNAFLDEIAGRAGNERLGAEFKRGTCDWVAEDI